MERLLRILAECSYSRVRIYFKDFKTGQIRTWTEYFDVPDLQGTNISIHIQGCGFLPAFWSVNGEEYYHVSEYTWNNVKVIKLMDDMDKERRQKKGIREAPR